MKINFLIISFTFLIMSCIQDPNVSKDGKNLLEKHEVTYSINKQSINYRDTIYVPVYSHIYVNNSQNAVLLAATLSIRNTSPSDSLFVDFIDYYNTEGQKVKEFTQNTLGMKPMESIDYVIEKQDDTGGLGANFLIGLSSNKVNIKPLVQAVMIGDSGQQGISFVTDGYSLKSK